MAKKEKKVVTPVPEKTPLEVLQESVNHLIEIVTRLESRFDKLGGGF